MYSSSSPNGPWTSLGDFTTNTNGHNNCGRLDSNATFTLGPDNRFWATSRGGCIMDSNAVLGTYKVETDSVLPNLQNNDNNNAEDEVIWYSGGYYHIVYNYWNVRKAYHLMSKDGTTNWTSTGIAYDPTMDFLKYTDGTVNHWHNIERPGVVVENGHVTHFTFAVTDVDKDTATLINSGGSKILVVPFDGVQFDCDNGDPVSCDGGAPLADAGADATTDGGHMTDAAVFVDGGGNSSSGSSGSSGGADSGVHDGGGAAGGSGGSGGSSGSNGGGESSEVGNNASSGCSCRVGSTGGPGTAQSGLLVVAAGLLVTRRRRARR
jgi:MYXO-CTERM domain-containing protein